MADRKAYYWKVHMPEGEFPVRINERTNQKVDITTSDWSMHWHESLEFQYILEGEISFSCNNRTATLGPGDVFFAGWCIPHHPTGFTDGTRYYVVQLDTSFLFSEEKDSRFLRYQDLLTIYSGSFSCFIRQDRQLTAILDRIIRIYREQAFGWELEFKGKFLTLFSRMFSNYCRQSQLLANAQQYDKSLRYTRWILNYITSHYTGVISLDDIAQQLNLTKSYLCRLFRQHTGMTIMNYTNRLRCYQAIYLMETGATVTQAALSVGFNDYNYFSRVFKQIIGCSPSTY